MIISGIQKMTLLDYPGRVAATIFTQGCNFRCPFCYNASLLPMTPQAGQVSEQDVLDLLKKRAGILDGLCISGGEPLLQADIASFIGQVKSLNYLVKLDTNGSQPDKLKQLVEQGMVDYVAMDIKNCLPRYGETIGLANYDTAAIEASVEFLRQGTVDYEFRTTIVKEFHRPQDMELIASWLQGAPKYYLQSFTSSGDIVQPGLTSCSKQELSQFLSIVRQHIPQAEIRGR